MRTPIRDRFVGFLFKTMHRTSYYCRIDRGGCVGCASRVFQQKRVICESLAETWGLSSRERALFDQKEGNFCSNCGLSKRVRMIVWSLRKLLPDLGSLDILHLNQINGLKPILAKARSVTETVYQPDLPPCTMIEGSVNEDMAHLSFENDRFDLVIHSETLEHLYDYEAALAEVLRVLKPGGRQIYTIPLLHNRTTRRRIGLGSQGEPTHLLPLSYHGNEGEYPVVWEFGGDFLKKRKPQIEQIYYDNYWRNRTVFSIVERKALPDADHPKKGSSR
jgi:SAM-dependent methyltransferase